MRLPDEILKSVVFIGKKRVDGEIRYGGTGFLLYLTHIEEGKPFHFGYLVTANHVSEQIRGGVFYIRVNQKSGQAAEDVPLNWDQGEEVVWHTHPNDAQADVAITPIHPQKEHDVLMLPTEELVISDDRRNDLGIGVGDEVFMVGLFSYVKGKARSIPIVRVGNIAMFPDERVKVKTPTQETLEVEGFLVEARSIKSASGSPVFARRTISIEKTFHKLGTNIFETVGVTAATLYLIGLVCAHWDIKPGETIEVAPTGSVNVGIAVIIPAQKILDILYGPELTDLRRKIVERSRHR
jgi:hypothetical protein